MRRGPTSKLPQGMGGQAPAPTRKCRVVFGAYTSNRHSRPDDAISNPREGTLEIEMRESHDAPHETGGPTALGSRREDRFRGSPKKT